MKLFALALIALAAIAAPAQTTTAQPPLLSTNHTVLGSWVAAGPNCASYGGAATATTNCVSGYTVVITPPPGVGGTNTVTNCAAGATANCLQPAAVSFSWAPGGALYCGPWVYSVAANWVDNSGNAATSTTVTAAPGTAACPSAPFAANPPTGLTGTVTQ